MEAVWWFSGSSKVKSSPFPYTGTHHFLPKLTKCLLTPITRLRETCHHVTSKLIKVSMPTGRMERGKDAAVV